MKVLKIGGLLGLALCIAVSAYAHHSAAGIDQTKSVSQEGVVKQFKWANPHSWLEVEVTNAKGVAEVWNLEMNPPSYLVRAGWKSTSVKPGDKIKFTARPFKNGDPGESSCRQPCRTEKYLRERHPAAVALHRRRNTSRNR